MWLLPDEWGHCHGERVLNNSPQQPALIPIRACPPGDPEDASAGLLLAVLWRQGEKNQRGSVNTPWAVEGSAGLSRGEARSRAD